MTIYSTPRNEINSTRQKQIYHFTCATFLRKFLFRYKCTKFCIIYLYYYRLKFLSEFHIWNRMRVSQNNHFARLTLVFFSRIHRESHARCARSAYKHNRRRVHRPHTRVYARITGVVIRFVSTVYVWHVGSAAYVAHVRKNKSYCFWNRVYLGGPPVTLVRQSDKKFNDVIALSKHGQTRVSASAYAYVCTYIRGVHNARCTRRRRCTRDCRALANA